MLNFIFIQQETLTSVGGEMTAALFSLFSDFSNAC
jgi:hypothetical protein